MARQFETDRPTIEEIRKLRQPRTHSVALPIDAGLLEEIAETERELAVAKRIDDNENRDPEAPAIEERLAALRAEAETAVVIFTFRELPRKAYRALVDEHPDPDGKMRWHEETFAPALIAACCADPEMTLADATAVWDEWSEVATQILYGAAVIVNEGKTRIPFGVSGSGRTHGSAPSSPSATSEG